MRKYLAVTLVLLFGGMVLGLTMAAPALSAFLGDRLVRRIVGFGLVVLALWMLLTLVNASTGGHH